MPEKHDPNIAEKILISIFPFLAGIMGYSTAQIKHLDQEWPLKAKYIADNQNAVGLSKEQAKKAKLS